MVGNFSSAHELTDGALSDSEVSANLGVCGFRMPCEVVAQSVGVKAAAVEFSPELLWCEWR